jgi:1-acyl-sn-glycerol-3-phosphate acyltransferase
MVGGDGVRFGPVASTVWLAVRAFVWAWFGARRIGPCTVPRRGPVILASNHTSGADALIILGTCNVRIVSFVIDRKYAERPVAGWFIGLARCIPIDRARPAKSALAQTFRLLRDGGCLGIFPQGTYLPPDQDEPPPQVGVGAIALRTGAAVIPCHIAGTRYDYEPMKALLRRHPAQIRFGPPVDLADLRAQPRRRAAHRAAADRIMRAIRDLAPDP